MSISSNDTMPGAVLLEHDIYLLKKITKLEECVQQLEQQTSQLSALFKKMLESEEHLKWVERMNRTCPGWDSWDAGSLMAHLHDDE